MNVIWILVIFGLDWNSSQQIPQASRERCLQQAAWYEDRLSGTRVHAFCIEGVR